MWPSQNIWTLCNCKQAKIQDNLKVSFLSLVRISWTNESNFVHPKSNLHNRKHRHATLLIQISFDWKNKAASKITRQQQNYDSPKPTYLFIRVQREWVTPIFLPIKSLVVRFNNIIYNVYHRASYRYLDFNLEDFLSSTVGSCVTKPSVPQSYISQVV